jgi:hypothetical protein
MSDTVATLQGLLGPKPGMHRIPFALDSYQHPSPPLSSKRLLNLFSEQEPADARTVAALISTPGLLTSFVCGVGPIRAMNSDLSGRVYIASGDHFYRWGRLVAGVPVLDDLGPIGTPVQIPGFDKEMTTIAVGPTAVVVCVPPNAFTQDHTGLTLNQLGVTFPGAATVAYIDGYFVFTAGDNTSQFFVSHLLDPTLFDALDFAFADGVPNVVRRVITHLGELWLIGENGVEIWYDSGDLDFPFRRQVGGVIPHGCASPQTVAQADGSVFWGGVDGIIYRSNGYTAVRISSHAVEAMGMAFGTDALTYSQNGHIFYCITLGNRTMAYDCTTKQWADRSSAADGSTRWLPSATANDPLFLGDSASGNIYVPVPGLSTDNGVVVRRSATMPPIWAGTNRAFMNRLEVEMEVGTAGSAGDPLTVDWSDDGGITWNGGPRPMDAGSVGQTRKRVFTTRLGSFHQLVLRLTRQGSLTLYAVDADISQPLGGG